MVEDRVIHVDCEGKTVTILHPATLSEVYHELLTLWGFGAGGDGSDFLPYSRYAFPLTPLDHYTECLVRSGWTVLGLENVTPPDPPDPIIIEPYSVRGELLSCIKGRRWPGAPE